MVRPRAFLPRTACSSGLEFFKGGRFLPGARGAASFKGGGVLPEAGIQQICLSQAPDKPGAAVPLAKVMRVIVIVTVRVASALRAVFRLGPRSGNFAGSRGQFHEKISAAFSSDVCFSRLCVWREGETPQRKCEMES